MSTRLYFMISILALMMMACSSTRGVYDAGAAAAGGVIANKLSDGDPLMTGVGAAGGVAVSEIAQTISAKQGETQYKKGYQQGRSDAVKQQYWIIQNQQKESSAASPHRVSTIPITVGGGTNSDGTITVPTTQNIRVEE